MYHPEVGLYGSMRHKDQANILKLDVAVRSAARSVLSSLQPAQVSVCETLGWQLVTDN